MPLNPTDVRRSLAVLHPEQFMAHLSKKLKQHGNDFIDTLCEIARDPANKGAVSAIKTLLTLGGAMTYMSTLGALAAKQQVEGSGGTVGDDEALPDEARSRLEALAEGDDPADEAAPEVDPGATAPEGPPPRARRAGRVHGGGVEGRKRKARKVRQDPRD